MSQKRLHVYSVFNERLASAGTSRLRGVQLCALARRHPGDRYDFSMMRMPARRRFGLQTAWAHTRPRNVIYVLTKDRVQYIDPEAAEILRSRSRGVLFDYVDTDMTKMHMTGADLHLCASHAQLDYVKGRLQNRTDGGVADLLLHSCDARLDTSAGVAMDRLRAAYIGAPEYAGIPPALTADIPILDAGSDAKMTALLKRLNEFNFHYCVRAPTVRGDQVIFKPFTKGATAAALGANVIVNRGTHDAARPLGGITPI